MAKSKFERADDIRVMKLFRGRCVVCMKPATEVHELVPRSRAKDAITMPNNRIPLDTEHHRWAHHDGYTQEKEEFLRSEAIKRLAMFGVSLEKW